MLSGAWPRAQVWPSWLAVWPHWLHVQRPSCDCDDRVSATSSLGGGSVSAGPGSGGAQPLSAAAAISKDEPRLVTVNSDVWQFMRTPTTLTMTSDSALAAATFGIRR